MNEESAVREPPPNAESAARFVFKGDFAPEDISDFVGLTPTRTTRAGELVSDIGDYRRAFSTWELKSEGSESLPIGEHLQIILDTLKPQWAKLIELSKRYEAWFLCRVYINEAQGPEMSFNSEILKRVAELGGQIDVDVYCLAGGEDT
jgi:hypothetical protein